MLNIAGCVVVVILFLVLQFPLLTQLVSYETFTAKDECNVKQTGF